jgi:hypothetical protein
MLVGLKSLAISLDYRSYMGSSARIWSLRWLFLYLCSYNLDGFVTTTICNICSRISAHDRPWIRHSRWHSKFLLTFCFFFHISTANFLVTGRWPSTIYEQEWETFQPPTYFPNFSDRLQRPHLSRFDFPKDPCQDHHLKIEASNS